MLSSVDDRKKIYAWTSSFLSERLFFIFNPSTLTCFVQTIVQANVFIYNLTQHHFLSKHSLRFLVLYIYKTKMTITTTMTNSNSGPGSSAVKNLSRTAKNNDSTSRSTSTSVTAIIANNKKTNTNNTNNGKQPSRSSSKAKSASLPSETVEYLKAWMMSAEHIAHPYPTEQEKVEIMNDTGIELKQLTNWFVNNRKRYWKPRVEARLQQQAQQAAQATVQKVLVSVTTCAGSTSTVGGQQQQTTATTTTAVVKAASVNASANANLVSPSGFNSINKSQLTTITGSNKLLTYDDIRKERDIADNTSTTTATSTTSSSSSLQDESFASSPLTFAAIMLEQQKYSVPSISVLAAQVSENSNSNSSVASVSASEGEMSCDFGSDDASSSSSSDDDLKFVNKKKSSTTTSSSTSYPQEETKYTRSVSFCSLEYFSSEIFAVAPQEIIKMNETIPSSSFTTTTNNSSSNSRKRTLLVNEEGFPVGLTTTTTTTGTSSPPRKRFRTVSIDLWIDACRKASHVYNDECLPSLEEASRLFGYTH
jgi:hypothetical protein